MIKLEIMLRKANIDDAEALQALINFYAKQDKMLPRSLIQICENIRDYYVCEKVGGVVGCVALHITLDGLAEVKSLAVAEGSLCRNIGRRLVEAAIEEARGLRVRRIFVLTYEIEFFKKQGFRVIDKAELPHKIWNECVNCIKFPDCNEEAMIRDLK